MKNTAPQDQNLKEFQLSGDASSKSTKEYGDTIIAQIDRYINSTYFLERNRRFNQNEAMVTGKMDFKEIQALFGMMQGDKKDYTKIIWKGIMIVNTIVSRLVGRWMDIKEKAIVKGVDPTSVNKKQEEIDKAQFYMEFKKELIAVQQQSGVPMAPANQFVPDDKDHLDIWTKYELYLPEEYLYGKEINNVLDKAGFGFTGINRRRLKHNSATFGLVGTYVWADKNGGLHTDWINPKNIIYSYSEYDDFRDVSWKGHIVSKKLSEIRELFPDLKEQDLYDNVVTNAVEWNKDDKITNIWNNTWANCYVRPYDDWNVDLVMFELKSLDTETTSMKVTSNGSLLIEKGKSGKLNGNVLRETKDVWNIYQAIYVKKNRYQLKWAIKENPVKPQDSTLSGYSDFSYSFYMYQNVGMRNLAIPEKVEEPVIQMLIARFKIQQLVAGMRKSGLAVDISGTTDIDLGTGEGKLNQMQLQRVYDQTGNVYYSSLDAEGIRRDIPFKELANAGSVAQLQELVTIYNFHLQVLRDESGINEQAEGQSAKPRTTNDSVQTAIQYSENATDYMNDAPLAVMKETAKKLACLLHDSVEFGSQEYAQVMQEEYVKDRVYDVSIEIGDTDDEINMLMGEVNAAIQTNQTLVLYCDPMKIRTIANDSVELASVYFRRAQKNAILGQQQQAQQQIASNGQQQQASAQQAQQAAMAAQQMKSQNEMDLAKERQREIILQGIWNTYSRGVDVPALWKSVENEIINNIGLPLFAQNAAMQAQASQIPHPNSPQDPQGQDGQQQPQDPQQQMQPAQQPQGQPMQQ